MHIYQCNLTLHDNVFFATREMGTLYETEKYLHNWALTYAFFSETHIPRPYRMQGKTAQQPGYLDPDHEQNLLQLNGSGLYLFPAKPLRWSYQVNTFKAAQVAYYGQSKQFGAKGAKRNYPINFGRAKELAVGSTYRTYLISPQALEIKTLPQWIRLGKWAGKIHVQYFPLADIERKQGTFICTHPLNPMDLPPQTQLKLYDRIVMPPVSLVSQAQLEGAYWQLPNGKNLPADLAYGVGYAATA
ncbi:type I-D CRISPR-associated protein Cas5/Csc1 [Leptothoe sp. EHU-05/26/07-4]|uniref:Type I-D CRISPR-associated protein Cas5/Csc1 n=1 Tax=Adonisia turfae CCMR0081 TaxID=2292702 RepID=A0A6M0RGB9_9CYAN|nr:type I-D CRISPR-associated protein Cas5/Csc1 [Adonisia turfae]NEZ54671.1 type I-D CRISPR-associated protein Cas5/Csc1 [Adonisia turfae CCMR0081]